ncbi:MULTISPECIES: alpha/beta fold hydrolase [Agrobacterium]|uniref:alpha/beta hydrolase family protein n=1 Tax=Agrobacterium TaxID=357 RepID=UPI000DBF5FC0|nr:MULTISPECIES: alpha/beta fold hydrolase [Agrobacterium]MDH0871353.1 alpha/beta fold hydrolase [Agrobacterium pusense]RAL96658.1 chlorophyllase [Agrobacterium sp. MS2]HAU77847.1 chlorophyllase [Agrobacterium sp.]
MSSSLPENRALTAGFPAIVSIAPITLPSPGRGIDLHVRVSFPVAGDALPVIIFSHGNGQSFHAYGPLVDYWTAHGFAVIQPTHLDSRMLGLAPDDPRRPQLWRFREKDLAAILDGLDHIESEAPMIRGRLDHSRIAVGGHSWGGQTASTLLGATHLDPDDGSVVNKKDNRIKAGVLLAAPGRGNDLTEYAARTYPFMYPDFSTMTAPTLIIVGDRDVGTLSTRGAEWWRDAYDLSPSPKALFTAFGGEHALGGIPGYEARETTDERPQRVDAIQRLSTAYLRSALYPGDLAFSDTIATLAADAAPEGSVETK